jgi:hypothetical protein
MPFHPSKAGMRARQHLFMSLSCNAQSWSKCLECAAETHAGRGFFAHVPVKPDGLCNMFEKQLIPLLTAPVDWK